MCLSVTCLCAQVSAHYYYSFLFWLVFAGRHGKEKGLDVYRKKNMMPVLCYDMRHEQVTLTKKLWPVKEPCMGSFDSMKSISAWLDTI